MIEWTEFNVISDFLLYDLLLLRRCGLARVHGLESFRTLPIRLHSLTWFPTYVRCSFTARVVVEWYRVAEWRARPIV